MIKSFFAIILLATSSLTHTKENFTDHAHRTLSKRVTGFAKTIDNFFGTKKDYDRINKTRLRICYPITK